LNQNKLIQLEPYELIYQTKEILTQFKLVGKYFVTNDTSALQIKLVFKRILLYHLVSTYFPMLCLLIIAEVTLFFDEANMQAAIALTLTILLVMYTMYQGISSLMPKTAYLKFIDVWVFFCLLVPFIVFLIEVAWELGKSKRKSNTFEVTPNSNAQGWIFSPPKNGIAIQNTVPYRAQVQIATIFVTLSFVVGYILVAVFWM
jgi:hypothetical protein